MVVAPETKIHNCFVELDLQMAAEKKSKKKTVKKTVNQTVKKTSPKKTAASSPTKKTAKKSPKINHKPLTEKQIEHFEQVLLAKRREIIGDVDHMRNEALDSNRQESSGDLSNMPIHMADIGTDNYEQEFTLGLIESERKQLVAIDRALNKISEGTYGICEATGEPIILARLEAVPEARYCVEYARKIEQGLITIDQNAFDNAKSMSKQKPDKDENQ